MKKLFLIAALILTTPVFAFYEPVDVVSWATQQVDKRVVLENCTNDCAQIPPVKIIEPKIQQTNQKWFNDVFNQGSDTINNQYSLNQFIDFIHDNNIKSVEIYTYSDGFEPETLAERRANQIGSLLYQYTNVKIKAYALGNQNVNWKQFCQLEAHLLPITKQSQFIAECSLPDRSLLIKWE